MDCPRPFVVALGLLAGLSGCQHSLGDLRSVLEQNATGRPDAAGKVYKPETYLAYGEMKAHNGFSPDFPPVLQKENREEARLAYLEALKVNPKFTAAHLALARLYQACEDYPQANASFQAALKLNEKDPAAWYELGMCQGRQKDWNGAVASLTNATRLDPDNRQYVNTLGFALLRAGRPEQAMAVFLRVNDEARAHYHMARMLKYMGLGELAHQHATLSAARDPSFRDAQTLVAELEGRSPPAPAVQTAQAVQGRSPVQSAEYRGGPPPAAVQPAGARQAVPQGMANGPGARPRVTVVTRRPEAAEPIRIHKMNPAAETEPAPAAAEAGEGATAAETQPVQARRPIPVPPLPTPAGR